MNEIYADIKCECFPENKCYMFVTHSANNIFSQIKDKFCVLNNTHSGIVNGHCLLCDGTKYITLTIVLSYNLSAQI